MMKKVSDYRDQAPLKLYTSVYIINFIFISFFFFILLVFGYVR